MEALNKRGTALVLCLLMIVFSALVGARLSLMQLRGEAEQVFRDGVDGSGQGIAYDLAQILDESHNVSVIAGRNLSADNATLQDMLEKRGALAVAASPSEQYGAAQALRISLSMLGELLEMQAMTEQDEVLLARCRNNIEAHYSVIARSGYNEAAVQFNQTLGKFPANVLGTFSGVRPLELYA